MEQPDTNKEIAAKAAKAAGGVDSCRERMAATSYTKTGF
jgi:hypothetical protein